MVDYLDGNRYEIDLILSLVNDVLRADVAKSNNNKEYMVCYYLFCNHRFKFQNFFCTGYHDLIMLCLNLSDIIIITVKNVNLRCIFL